MEYPLVNIPDSLKEKNESPISFKLIGKRDPDGPEVIAEGSGSLIICERENGMNEAYVTVDQWPKAGVGKATFHRIPLSQRHVDVIEILEEDGTLRCVDPNLPDDPYDHP